MVALSLCIAANAAASSRPNVLVILTDDQGYGDLAFHGNPHLRTPNLDKFARESVRFSHFYVSPVCSPTRSSLLTGHYNYRTGVIDTYLGRSMMFSDELTLAEILREAGYRTGIFGKWHLGDNYPMRPIDQGFEEALVHKGGGIGQPSDPPGGESYFDPILQHNGRPVKAQGYCSDIFTDAAIAFMETNRSKPFLAWLAFNAPHTPLEVPAPYYNAYKDKDLLSGLSVPQANRKTNNETTARIYGMVNNIDDNIGRLLARLNALNLAPNTLIIFLTDNGPQQPRFNGGLRGLKGSVYEGGIRVPFFMQWRGKLAAGRAIDVPAAHIDFTPTILEACGIQKPRDITFDGRSLWPLLTDSSSSWPDRMLFFQWHRGDEPESRRAFAVRGPRYKLVQARGVQKADQPVYELFDIAQDPNETRDLARQEPQLLKAMLAEYDRWFQDVMATRGANRPRIIIGHPAENSTILTRQDWRGPKAGWTDDSLGHWDVDVRTNGVYEVIVRFKDPGPAATLLLQAGDFRRAEPVTGTSHQFHTVNLAAGSCTLQCWLERDHATNGVQTVEITLSK